MMTSNLCMLYSPESFRRSVHTPLFVSYSFRPPTSPEDALAGADSQLDYRHQNKDGMYGVQDRGLLPLRFTLQL